MSKIYSILLKTIILPVADRVMKTDIMRYYKELLVMRNWSKDEIHNWQNQKLQCLVQFAYNHTEYYKDLFDRLSINPKELKTAKDLMRIPVLTKNDIINNFNKLIPSKINEIKYKESSTGGSTGEPLVYWLDNKSWSFNVANTMLNWERTGYKFGDKYVALGSTSLFVDKKKSIGHMVYYRLKNKIGLNGVNMSEKVCEEYTNLIKRKNIRFIYGYASAIYLLAKYVRKKEIKLNIIACMPTSEILTNIFRREIKLAFKCKILDGYGASDGGITAFEHNEGCFEVGYNSIVNTIPIENGVSQVLLTDLNNYAMPMINYKLGDEVIMNNAQDGECDFNGQVIEKVLGRTSDVIELENGNVLTGPGFTILFKDIPVEYYYIEKTGINRITCTMKKLNSFTINHEKIILSTFMKQMGNNAIINLEYSDEIKYSKSGKQKYFN